MALRRTLLTLAWVLAAVPAASAADVADVVRSGYAEVPGGKIFYEASGQGPHVVFLSGGNWMGLGEWDGQFLRFSRSFQAIRFDARGSGKSDPAASTLSRADDIGAFLDALRLSRVHLVGLSRSAGAALDFALAHPERVLSLVLVSPIVSGWAPSEQYRKREAEIMGALKKKGAKAFAQAALDDPYLVRSSSKRKARKLLEANAGQLLASDPRWKPAAGPPAIERLAEVRAPTLLVLGEEDDPELLDLANVLAAGIPNARKVTVFGAGHSVNLERSRKFNSAVMEFIRSTQALGKSP